ncbi:unnamed protein product [Heligmosomoides polygyrus]|uniref:Uncharacterized protein n=1 Tax=Heligmosomoides polygyrus TaxID=6339 RepID=A0A183GD81_HELPZ|nr:unnamed protein product [Heligmosomoides polygyrus]
MSIDENLIPAKRMFVTTTLAVIMFTTIVQGTTIKSIVNLLKVKRSQKPKEKKRVFDYVANELNKHVIDFVENLTNLHGENLVYRKILEFDQCVLKPKLVAYYRPRTANIIDRHMEIELTEFAMSVKRAGGSSFSGMPTNNSVSELHLPTSKSELFAAGFDQNSLMPPCAPQISLPHPTVPPKPEPAPSASIPRNTSVTGLVEQAFETSEQQRNQARGKARRSVYSRHLLEKVPPSPTPVTNEDDVAYVMTLPHGGKNPRLAQTIRQFSIALRDQNQSNAARLSLTSRLQGVEASHKRPTDPPPKTERTVHGSSKTFTVGGEETRELLPIREEERNFSPV